MSKDHTYSDNQDANERDGSIASTLADIQKEGGSRTSFAESVISHGHAAREFEDAIASQDERQTPAETAAGDGEENQQDNAGLEALERLSTRTPVHSIFSVRKKRFIVFMTAWGGLFSPMSANIYFAALNPLSRALGVSDSLMNLT